MAQEELVVATSTNNVSRSLVGNVARYDATAQGICRINRATIEADLNAGYDVLLHSADHISIEASITKTAGADSRITFKANRFVAVRSNVTATSGKLDIIVWADAFDEWDESGGDGFSQPNFILINSGITLNSNGGMIVLGGGDDDGSGGRTSGDGIPDGYAYNGRDQGQFSLALNIPNAQLSGVQIGPRSSGGSLISILSEGGDIDIRGRTGGDNGDRQDQMPGISSQNNFIIDADTGTITMVGVGRHNHGIELTYGGVPNFVIRSKSSVEPAISMEGYARNATQGIWFSNNTAGSALIQSESLTGGGVYMRGATGSGRSILLGHVSNSNVSQSTRILSASGEIELVASSSTSSADLSVNSELFLGADTSSTPPTIHGVTALTSSDAKVTVRANDLDFSNFGTDATVVATSGDLHLEPITAGADFYSSWLFGNLSLSNHISGGSRVIVGDNTGVSASQPSFYLNSDVALARPLAIYADMILMESTDGRSITLTQSGDSLSLYAQGHISATKQVNLSTNGGDIILATDIDNNNGGGERIHFQRGVDIQSNGGDITLGGGDLAASGYAMGSGTLQTNSLYNSADQFTTTSGVVLDGIVNMQSSGGNITIRGKSAAVNAGSNGSFDNGYGVGSNSTTSTKTLNSGTGKIYIDGESQITGTGVNRAMGQYWAGNVTITSANTESDAITLIGKNTNTGKLDYGIEFNDDNDPNDYISIAATGAGGGILIQGLSGSTRTEDLYFNTNMEVLAASGPIIIEGLSNNGQGRVSVTANNTVYVGAKAASSVTSSSADITIKGDGFTFANDMALLTTGDITIEPIGNTFVSSFTTGIFTWVNSNFANITIGKASNTSTILVNSDISTTGNINLYGSQVTVDSALTAGQNIGIESLSAGLTQTAPLSATGLYLSGTGAATLTNASNNVTTFAAGGVGLSNISYYDADSFTVGSVGSVSGISASGQIDLRSQSGNITVSHNISTTSNANEAIRINADSDESAGNDGNGNIIISGSPTISAPNGYTLFFTGTQAGSTGLYNFVGGGTNSVNNADETNYSTAFTNAGITLSTGQKYAVYRQTAALPVEWLYFRAQCDGLQSVLTWATAMEENNDYFEVQRSTDTHEWETIGHLQGAGTSLTEQYYTYTDLTPATGVRYYRIRQVDFDGTHSYSDIVTTQCKNDNASDEYLLFPNPAHQIATLVVPSATGYVQVHNALGQLVYQTRIQATHTTIPVDKLQAGLYHVTLQSGSDVTTLPLLVD